MITETFYDTDPVRLGPDKVETPFEVVEEFFRLMSIADWRVFLKGWLKRVLTTEYMETEVPGDLIFMHEQLTQLIEAGYHISKQKLEYKGKKTFAGEEYTAGEWLLKVRDRKISSGHYNAVDYSPQLLNEEERKDPQRFIYNFFQPAFITQLRISLYEWMKSALGNEAIWELDENPVWDHYENLEKMIEGFYLLLTQDVVHEVSDEQETGDDVGQQPAVPGETVFFNIQDDIQTAFNQIMTIVPADKIFRVDHQSAGSENGKRDWVDLLVVVPPDCPTTFSKLEKLVKLAGIEDGRVSVTFYSYGGLLVPIKKGQLFYLLAFNHGNLIYDNGKRPLPEFPYVQLEEIRQSASIEFQPNYKNALAFYEGAVHYQALGRLGNSVFMLQQATELCFRGMGWALLSLDKRTHSIRGLMKLNRRVAPQMNAVFPCDSEEEERLLQLLEDAYIDARYKKEYEIAEDDVLILIARVRDLLEITKHVFDEKIRHLDSISGIADR